MIIKLTDKQSLFLCGSVTLLIFVAGILDVLDNFLVLTILSIIFLTIVANLFLWKPIDEKSNQEQHTS